MTVKIEKFKVYSKGYSDIIDITNKIQDIVYDLSSKCALLNVFVVSSCASIITLDSEPALSYDVAKLLDLIVPINKVYQHDNVWHEGNAYAHLRASMLGNNITLPVVDGAIVLDIYQQIVMIDFDNKPSQKEIVVTITE